MDSKSFIEHVRAFSSEMPEQGRGFTYEAFQKPVIPFPSEILFLKVLDDWPTISAADATEIRASLNILDCYTLAAFAVRMAVYAARSGNPEPMQRAMVSFVLIGEDGLDWRDEIIYLSIINDCAVRIGIDLRATILAYESVASVRRKNQLAGQHRGYASIESMGLRSREGPDGIEYFRWP
jgi:hypothetical protein